MTATIAPALGGAVMRVAHGGRDLLRPAESAAAVSSDPRAAACFPCVPWFGRLYGALTFAGASYDLAPTLPACDREYALHGHGWVNPWRLVNVAPHSVACRFDYTPVAGGFPFALSAEQRFTVGDNSFDISLSLKNTGAATMPAGLALHPYFARSETTRLMLGDAIVWMDPNAGAPKRTNITLPAGALPLQTVDLSADQWGGEARIIQDGMQITLSADTPIAHLYAPAGELYFCIEPITHLPGAFGCDTLSAGAVMTMTMRLSLD